MVNIHVTGTLSLLTVVPKAAVCAYAKRLQLVGWYTAALHASSSMKPLLLTLVLVLLLARKGSAQSAG
jgi:hypothetical protein